MVEAHIKAVYFSASEIGKMGGGDLTAWDLGYGVYLVLGEVAWAW